MTEDQEEQHISTQLAHQQFTQKLQDAVQAVSDEKWAHARDLVDTAEDALTGYSYGYPDPTGLAGLINDAQAAIDDQDQDKALAALRAAIEQFRSETAKVNLVQPCAKAHTAAQAPEDEKPPQKDAESRQMADQSTRDEEPSEQAPEDDTQQMPNQPPEDEQPPGEETQHVVSQPAEDEEAPEEPSNEDTQQMADQPSTEPENESRLQLAVTSDIERTANNELRVIVMDAGQGNGFDWTPDALRAGAPIFDGVTAFVNHERLDVAQQRPGRRVVDDICGVYYDPTYEPTRQAIVAKWRPTPPRGEWTSHILNTIIDDRQAGLPVPNIGISADVSFNHRNGKVTRLVEAHSADIVFDPARGPQAGAAFARIANAVQAKLDAQLDKESNPMPEDQVQDTHDEIEEAEETEQLAAPTTDTPTETPAPPAGRQAHPQPEPHATPTNPAPAPEPDPQRNTTPTDPTPAPEPELHAQRALQQLGDNAREMLGILAENLLNSTLQNSGLPPSAQRRIRPAFENQVIIDLPRLNAMIDEERQYLASLIEDEVIQDVGAEPADQPDPTPSRTYLGGHAFRVTVGHSPLDRVQLAVERWFRLPGDYADVPRIDMAQLYVDLTGDVNIRGVWDIEEARERTGLANITDTTFSDVVADSMNKVILHNWQVMAAEGYDWWQRVVQEKDFDSLFNVEWTSYGGFGDLPKLNAGQEYPELSIADLDTSESAGPDNGNWVKPGGIITVPIETFDKGGPLGAFQGLPAALGVSAIRTLSGDVANIFTSNAGVGPTLQDGVALFNQANHLNLRTTALSFAGWDEAVQDHFKQTEQNSDKRLGIRPWGILVPIEKRGLGIQVLSNPAEHGTTDRNINPYQYAEERVLCPPEFTDSTDWASFANPKVFPGIGVGYRFGRKPEVVPEPGGEKSYGRFVQDVLRWKVFWFYTVSVINYRALQKRNVAGS